MARKKTKSKTKLAARQRLPGDLNAAQEVARMLRVDHAGEFGAQRIYAGQLAVLGRGKLGAQLRHMAAQEDDHLRHFETLLNERGVRPTALHPLWHLAGFALGAGTALLGEKAAMACTVAVEEVIDGHYAQQLAALDAHGRDDESDLKDLIARFQSEEVEHKEIGRSHGAEDLPYYPLLRALIRAGSKTAIWLSERV
jgi:ubiquinone biosynthesis monooxygenase Coq7